jgi:hypothetical protein
MASPWTRAAYNADMSADDLGIVLAIAAETYWGDGELRLATRRMAARTHTTEDEVLRVAEHLEQLGLLRRQLHDTPDGRRVYRAVVPANRTTFAQREPHREARTTR